jgi:hypothetical protein
MTSQTHSDPSFFDALLVEVGKALLPLRRLGDEREFSDRISSLLKDLGFDIPGNVAFANMPKLIEQVDRLIDELPKLPNAETELDKLSIIAKISFSVGEISRLIIQTLVPNVESALNQFPDFLEKSNIELELPPRLLDYLIVTYIQRSHSTVFASLQLIGLVELSTQPANVNIFQPEFQLRKVHWQRFTTAFTNPLELAEQVYHWESDFNGEIFLQRLDTFLRALMTPGGLYRQNDLIQARTSSQGDEFRMPLFRHGGWPESYVELGLSISVTEPNNSHKGIAIIPYAFGQTDVAVDIAPGWELCFPGQVSFDEPFGILLHPPHNLSFASDLLNEDLLNDSAGSPEVFDFEVELKFQRKAQAGKFNIIGSENSTRLYLDGIYIFTFAKGTNNELDFGVEIGIDDAALIIQSGDGDGFLQKVLPSEPIETHISLSVGLTNQRGIYLGAEAGLEYLLPLHSFFGPIYLDNILFCLIANDNGLELQTTITGGLELGPLSAVVKDIGLSTTIDFTKPGRLGSSDLDFGFKPPTGAGLAIDAGGIIGGGYLEFDTINERYAGILALSFGEIALTAIGLIATKLPSGKQGFSMLINIGVLFDPPIELSYGFTLSGVGGLIGINRTMVTEALQRGFKNRTIDSILMPDPSTVIANASKIISDMRTVFPPEEHRFVIGPMVKIGWGTPKNIITADIGIFIEIPDPIRIALMGKVRAFLPEPEEPIVSIKMDILGVLDLEKKQLSFQASIYDSKILTFDLYGDTAFLLSWGGKPEFALAMGGFHPKFPVPPPPYIFADLKRLSLHITYEDILVLDCAAYQALTPNSLQFGAALDFSASVADASVTGHFSFDALFYFSPFSFEVSISGAVQIKALGRTLADIKLFFFLSGPQPWNARGTAKINILFFDISVDFNLIWGDPVPVIQPAVDPWELLLEVLAAPASWGSTLPQGIIMVEALRDKSADLKTNSDNDTDSDTEIETDIVIVHPAGTLEVRQNVVPLGVTLQKFGNSPITGHDQFWISEVKAGGHSIEPITYLEEFFARGDFEYLSPSQKTSLPSFEKMVGGIAFASRQIRTAGEPESKEIGYETIQLKPDRTSERKEDHDTVDWALAQKWVAGAAAAKSPLQHSGFQKFAVQRQVPKVRVEEEHYCIIDSAHLSLANEENLAFGNNYCVCIVHASTIAIADLDPCLACDNRHLSEEKAKQARYLHLNRHPEQAEALKVVPIMPRVTADQILARYRQRYPEASQDLMVVPSYEVTV